jgi:hypothetical protein
MIFLPMLALVFVSNEGSRASEIERAAVLSTAMEAVLATSTLVKDTRPGGLEKLSWSIRLSDRNWRLTLTGRIGADEVRFAQTGYLWGNEDADWLASFAGAGVIGKEPIYINGKADWLHDRVSDHRAMNFYNLVKFGDNSHWSWIVAAEAIFGGVVSAGGAIAGIVVATGGVGLPVAILVGAAAAVNGAPAMVSLSKEIKSAFESEIPVAPPPLPNRPSIPQRDQKTEPGQGNIVIVVSKDGPVLGINGDGSLDLNGKITGNAGTGVIFPR